MKTVAKKSPQPVRKTRIIRDTVHLDIGFDEDFFAILDTREFQRLHRIKQLSCEYMVFPNALHSRFAHCVGTYHIMKQLMDHFAILLQEMGYAVSAEDKKIGLAAALLHDIGHAGLSHTFEQVFSLQSHEKWGQEILCAPQTEIHQVICQRFGEEFLKKVLRVMDKTLPLAKEKPIFHILSVLVSSQIDADRMDYLLRDAYFTSVTNGLYDVSRLVRSFGLQNEQGILRIYTDYKYLATLEEYVLARYYMHQEVYQHPMKRQMEAILRRIFARAKQIWRSQSLPLHPVLEALFCGHTLTISQYLELDDPFLMYHIKLWREAQDPVLAFLCASFLDRNKFQRLRFSGDSERALSKVRAHIQQACLAHGQEPPTSFEDLPYYIEDRVKPMFYVSGQENVWVRKPSGKLVDLAKASMLIRDGAQKASQVQKFRVYVSRPLFFLMYGFELPPMPVDL